MVNTYEYYEKWFNDFSADYLKNEDNHVARDYMILKINHTKKVVEVIEELARGLNLSNEDIDIAKLLGLMHDVGRFPQIAKYKIDNDKLTEDHAKLSVSTIKSLGLLDNENEKLQKLIIDAVSYHNMMAIPPDVKDERTLLFSKLIRDADKIDIYRVIKENICPMTKEDLASLYDSLSFETKVSDELYDRLKQGIPCEYKYQKTFLDYIVLRAYWVIYDINFDISKRVIDRLGYIDMLFDAVEKDDRAIDIYQMIKDNLKEALRD